MPEAREVSRAAPNSDVRRYDLKTCDLNLHRLMQPDRNAIEAVRRHFYESGTTVTDWARERGFDRSLVYSVLNGRCLARRGASHRIAVALGLKPGADGVESEEATMKT